MLQVISKSGKIKENLNIPQMQNNNNNN